MSPNPPSSPTPASGTQTGLLSYELQNNPLILNLLRDTYRKSVLEMLLQRGDAKEFNSLVSKSGKNRDTALQDDEMVMELAQKHLHHENQQQEQTQNEKQSSGAASFLGNLVSENPVSSFFGSGSSKENSDTSTNSSHDTETTDSTQTDSTNDTTSHSTKKSSHRHKRKHTQNHPTKHQHPLILLLPHSASTDNLPHPLSSKTLYSHIAFLDEASSRVLSLNGVRMILEDNRLLVLGACDENDNQDSADSSTLNTSQSVIMESSRETQLELQKNPAKIFHEDAYWNPMNPKRNIMVLREAWIAFDETKGDFHIVTAAAITASGNAATTGSSSSGSLDALSSSPPKTNSSLDDQRKFRLLLISNPVMEEVPVPSSTNTPNSPHLSRHSKSTDSKLNDLIQAHKNSVSSNAISIESPVGHDVSQSNDSDAGNQYMADNSDYPLTSRKSAGPYTFKDFVEKMRHKNSFALVKKLKKFIADVNSHPYSDALPRRVRKFILIIMKEMERHPQWKDASDLEMENAREGVEKYIMTKIHQKCFSSTVDDVRIDQQLSNRLSSFKPLRPDALEIPESVIEHDQWPGAIEELRRMNQFKTPRDKMICISNCCRILFNILQRVNPSESAGADVFLPVLLYLVLQANPSHLHSNIKYINDYRNPDKMVSEAGYFLTNIQGAESFWLNCDASQLNIEEKEFDRLLGKQFFPDDEKDISADTPTYAPPSVEEMTGGSGANESTLTIGAGMSDEEHAEVASERGIPSAHPLLAEVKDEPGTESQGKLSEVSTEDEVAAVENTISVKIPKEKHEIITVHEADDVKKPYFFPRWRSNKKSSPKDNVSEAGNVKKEDRKTHGVLQEIDTVLGNDEIAEFVERDFETLTVKELQKIFGHYKSLYECMKRIQQKSNSEEK